MHPRNIYKNPPDLIKLTSQFPELADKAQVVSFVIFSTPAFIYTNIQLFLGHFKWKS
jgi:hypothetical protein